MRVFVPQRDGANFITFPAHDGRPIFATDDDQRHFVERRVRVFVAPHADLLA